MAEVMLHIVGRDPTTGKLIEYDKGKIGSHLSNSKELVVNKVNDGTYSIVLDSEDFGRLNPSVLTEKIITTFNENLDNPFLVLRLNYIMLEDKNNNSTKRDLPIRNKLKRYDRFLINLVETNSSNNLVYFDLDDEYHEPDYYSEYDENDNEEVEDEEEFDESMEGIDPDEFLYNYLQKFTNDLSEDKYEELEEDNEEEFGYNFRDVSNSVSGGISDIINQYDSNDDYDDEYEEDDEYDESYYSPYIHKSPTLTRRKGAKKEFKKYNMIIVNKKDRKLVKEDYKIILNFLKQFIPGNSKRQDERRREIAKRWLKDYIITTESIKAMQKEIKKQAKEKKKDSAKKGIENIVKGLISPLIH